MTTTTGWTLEYIETRCFLPQLQDLITYWSRNPPLHLMVKSYLGIKDEPAKKENNLADLVAMFPEGVIR